MDWDHRASCLFLAHKYVLPSVVAGGQGTLSHLEARGAVMLKYSCRVPPRMFCIRRVFARILHVSSSLKLHLWSYCVPCCYYPCSTEFLGMHIVQLHTEV